MNDREILRLENVDFVRESRQILTDINLTVAAGERWALIGPNGAGKSTILSMCGAVKHPTRGSVHVLGRKLGRVDIRELRESIGHVNPRHSPGSPLTARQVILTGSTGTTEPMPRWKPDAATRARADGLIEMLGIAGLEAARWPTLSQGERGRVLIARALLPDPPLLLLDEPSTGLDVAAREKFLATIDELHRARPSLATILVTHHLEELPTTTSHAMLIKDGRRHASGLASGVLTTELVSECFDHPIKIEHRGGRWQARAHVGN
ncbi:iron complex transport system ATP-binding protein [Arthrobacter stackebrandtii]|uniref:Iron complex transport system ATP-binding protein n=1 Tax=Arthrobacter stackebrandtii TaxID=272161 RepID=A0ABS4Z059_9MICC|nr:ATP-binding cassette domain-containing protein [Arthrobacter stackebrandtii]MBP2414102.1 iron complex transport system ATP-binding protein [Arthrobacter stackebrandtii]PYG99355.1 ABC transporter ATP-binding protein [Arthrobacter stackebrandtii]